MLFKNREQIISNGQTPELKQIRNDVLDILSAALDAVDPYNAVKSSFNDNLIMLGKENIDVSDFENVYLIGFGKASVSMAQAVCDLINIKKGVVITNDPVNKVNNFVVETIIGGHPIPDENSVIGSKKILDLMSECSDKDLLIVLISGGGSALLCKPRIPLGDLQITTELLLKSYANINEINTVRKHLSFVKGGQLVKFNNCMKISLIISDVIGDPLGFIASGPTYPDSTTFDDSKNILVKYGLWEFLPFSVKNIIEDGLKDVISETPNSI